MNQDNNMVRVAAVRLLALLLAVAVSACSHATSTHHLAMNFGRGAISFKHDEVVIKLEGQDEARVARDGSLSIGGEAVQLTPQARAALARYNSLGGQFLDQAVNLGLDSAGYALRTVGQMFAGLLEGDPDRAGREAERGGQQIKGQARELCGRLEQWRAAQDAAAAAAPPFAPYAVIKTRDTRDCFVDDHDDHDDHEHQPQEQAPPSPPAPQGEHIST